MRARGTLLSWLAGRTSPLQPTTAQGTRIERERGPRRADVRRGNGEHGMVHRCTSRAQRRCGGPAHVRACQQQKLLLPFGA